MVTSVLKIDILDMRNYEWLSINKVHFLYLLNFFMLNLILYIYLVFHGKFCYTQKN